MIDRSPRTPSSIVRPEPNSARTKSRRRPAAAAPPRRRERVALLTDRAHVGAALARASQSIKRRNARRPRSSGAGGRGSRPRARGNGDEEVNASGSGERERAFVKADPVTRAGRSVRGTGGVGGSV